MLTFPYGSQAVKILCDTTMKLKMDCRLTLEGWKILRRSDTWSRESFADSYQNRDRDTSQPLPALPRRWWGRSRETNSARQRSCWRFWPRTESLALRIGFSSPWSTTAPCPALRSWLQPFGLLAANQAERTNRRKRQNSSRVRPRQQECRWC